MVCIKKITLTELKSICELNKYISYKLEKSYLIYRKEYLKSEFENFSYIIQDKNKNFCLAIILFNKKENKFDFYGHNCELIYHGKLNRIIIKRFLQELELIKKKYKIKEVKFIIRNKLLIENDLFENNKIYSTNKEIIIDLKSKEDEIFLNFKPSLRNELNKIYPDIKYKIIDRNNYIEKEIIKMKNINEKVAGLEKRPLKTWQLNEKWIMENQGFLVEIKAKNEIIGYSLFYFNKITCKYFASCILTEYFGKYRNLQHVALWLAIKYSKLICHNFYIGLVIEESVDNISDKEINIGKFKSKFNKNSEKSFIINL
jgi:hypothetical protein